MQLSLGSNTLFNPTECYTDLRATQVCRRPGESCSKEPRRLQCGPLLPASAASASFACPAPGQVDGNLPQLASCRPWGRCSPTFNRNSVFNPFSYLGPKDLLQAATHPHGLHHKPPALPSARRRFSCFTHHASFFSLSKITL